MLIPAFRSTLSCRLLPTLVAAICFCLSPLRAVDSITSALPENYLPALSRILDTAMTESDSMRIRELSEEMGRGTELRLAAPSKFRARGSLSYRKERDIGGEDDFSDRIFYNFVLTKSIYHWGELKALRKKGKIAHDIQTYLSFDAFRSMALDIRSAYLELIARNVAVRVAEKELKLQNDLFEKESSAVEGGIASGDKLAVARDRKARADLALLQAQSDFEQHLRATAILAGVAADSLRSTLPDSIPAIRILEESSVDRLAASVNEALVASADLKRLEKSVEDAEQSVTIADSHLKPKVNFESGLTQFDLDDRGVRREEELVFAGVGIAWEIWDGARSKGEALEARSRREMALIQIDQAKRNLAADLQSARQLIEIAKLNLEIEEQFLERGKGILASIERKFEDNTASQQSLDGATRGVLKQELVVVRARAQYLNAVARLASQLGMDPAALKYIASKEAN